MRCPFCQREDDKVIDSRETSNKTSIRRRRECLVCGERFTTYERIEQMPYVVIKKNGEKEPFDRNKLIEGILTACKNRPVDRETIDELATKVQGQVYNDGNRREIPTRDLGRTVLEHLQQIDKVAYLRFVSVHQEFQDANQFVEVIRTISPEAGA
ncbi:MAG: transcriptional regulator NrdR [bacterium]